MADVADVVTSVVRRWPGSGEVRLIGSRARGEATALSDWDFVVDAELEPLLPQVVEPLDPLAAQWDGLSARAVFMLVLPSGEKVDLFPGDLRRPLEPPWRPGPGTLAAIDAHLWDWLLWLGSKVLGGHGALVSDELSKLHDHLLGPLGADRPPRSMAEAVDRYVDLRDAAEASYRVAVDRRLGDVVLGRLRDEGVVAERPSGGRPIDESSGSRNW